MKGNPNCLALDCYVHIYEIHFSSLVSSFPLYGTETQQNFPNTDLQLTDEHQNLLFKIRKQTAPYE